VYLVVERNFTPLLGWDACLDLQVLKFINLQLTDIPAPHGISQETLERAGDVSIFETDPVLCGYQESALGD